MVNDVFRSRDTLNDASDKGAVVKVRVLLGELNPVAVSNFLVKPLTPINASLKALGFDFVVPEILFADVLVDQDVCICESDTRLLGLDSGNVFCVLLRVALLLADGFGGDGVDRKPRRISE